MSIVFQIGIAEKNNKEIVNRKSIEVVASKGIIGDRYFHDFNGDREQITLIESENIDYYNNKFNTNFNYLDFRRNIITKNIELNDLNGKLIFVGAILPIAIIGLLWMITKRQGMGFGDIHLGLVLGTWLGPMRMAITLFIASSMSLLVWIFVSLLRGFDKDRALPFGPFLSVGGTGVYVGSFYYPDFFYLLMLQ